MTLALFDEIAPTFGGSLRVREINRDTATRWVSDWHYSGRMPGHGTIPHGAFCPDLAAVVILSIPSNTTGVAAMLGLEHIPGNMEISRVVAHPDAPRNTASRSIAACLRYWRGRGYRWVYSYADTGQGHHGGIYQALNGIYVGLSPARTGFLADGAPIHPRSLVRLYGTMAWPAVRDIAARDGVTLVKDDAAITAKHLYVLPTGSPAERRAIRRALTGRDLPYPKRARA